MIVFTGPKPKHIKALIEFRKAFKGNAIPGNCGLRTATSVEKWVTGESWIDGDNQCYILYNTSKDIVLAIARLSISLTDGLIETNGYNFSYSVHPSYRHNGYGFHIMCECIHVAKCCGVEEFLMAVKVDNVASWRCMEKVYALRIGKIGDYYIYCRAL